MEKSERGDNRFHGRRKEEHLRVSVNEPVEFSGVTTGLEDYYFIHQALPELALSDIDLTIDLFGKSLRAPVIISGMVGGIREAASINRNLAKAAQVLGLAMGVGSERCLIDTPQMVETYYVREWAPDILLFANLGAVQLNYGFGVRECQEIVRIIEADALVLHLNPLQESLQVEGNTNFSSLLVKIQQLCQGLSVPVIVKEVGWGISTEVAQELANAGVAGLDVAGAGGTSWSEIERRRATDKMTERVARTFSSWGIPTAESILMARKGAKELPIIASGGIRSGLDIAKSIALGADAAGIGLPLLKAAVESDQVVIETLKEMVHVLRIAMFCTGNKNLQKLKNSPLLRKK
jgi:isopentenyl-diphosphate Delta-isomerase